MCYQTYPGVCVYNIFLHSSTKSNNVDQCIHCSGLSFFVRLYLKPDELLIVWYYKDWHDWLFWPSFFFFFFICKSDEQLYLPLYLLGGLDEIFTKFQYIAELWINILQTFILILLIYFISLENIKFIPFLKTQKETHIFLCSLFAIHWFLSLLRIRLAN